MNDENDDIRAAHADDKTSLGTLIRMEPLFKGIGAKVHQEVVTEAAPPDAVIDAFIKLTAVLVCSVGQMLAKPGVHTEVIKQILEGVVVASIVGNPGLKEAMESDFKRPDDQSSN